MNNLTLYQYLMKQFRLIVNAKIASLFLSGTFSVSTIPIHTDNERLDASIQLEWCAETRPNSVDINLLTHVIVFTVR